MHATLNVVECRLVQASFAQVEPFADDVASRFYGRLFELDPELRPLFKTDIALQSAKFMETLAVAVKGLDDLDSIAPFVCVLGRRHASYGVRARDYDTLREALLWAIEEQLGPAFGEDVKAAWCVAYETVSGMMIEAGEG